MHHRVLALTVVLAAPLGAQRPPVPVTLPAADARLATEFSGVLGVRELSDGRLVVADRIDLGLVVADFRTQTTTPISRKGRGPNEYSMVARLYPIGGDSTIMADLMQRRWLILAGDSVAVTVPPDNPTVQLLQGLFVGADGLGHVVREEYDEAPSAVYASTEKDSSYLVRYDRATARVDTVARLMRRPTVSTRQTNAKGEVIMSGSRGLRLRVGEQYLLQPDGWLAVVRINPFRVDWRSPDGRWTKGEPLPIPVLKMTQREKQASLARTARSQSSSSMQLPPELRTPDDDWPDVMPPYIQGDLLASPEGHVIIRRQPSADLPGIAYYVVDRRGRLSGILALKDNEKLLAAGAKAIYVLETDDDGLQYIRRHPWPHSALPPG